MSLSRAQLKHLAELLRVDEIQEFALLRPAYGFALRVDDIWEKVEVDEPSVLEAGDPTAVLDRFVRKIFGAAQRLRALAERMGRRAALREFIDGARAIECVPMDLPTSTVFDLDKARAGLDQYAALDKPKPLNRFAAVAQELENT